MAATMRSTAGAMPSNPSGSWRGPCASRKERASAAVRWPRRMSTSAVVRLRPRSAARSSASRSAQGAITQRGACCSMVSHATNGLGRYGGPMLARFPAHDAAPVVAGDRVILCALEPRDAPAMLESDRDPETAARFGWDPAEAALWRCERTVEEAAATWRTGERVVFAVRESAGGPLAGIVDAQMRLRPPGADDGGPAVELSWTTVPAARGRGVATDAVRALVAYCGGIGVERVWAKID